MNRAFAVILACVTASLFSLVSFDAGARERKTEEGTATADAKRKDPCYAKADEARIKNGGNWSMQAQRSFMRKCREESGTATAPAEEPQRKPRHSNRNSNPEREAQMEKQRQEVAQLCAQNYSQITSATDKNRYQANCKHPSLR